MNEEVKREIAFAVASIWRGVRNGLFYGTKIRLPHALVMTLLFRRSPYFRKMADPIAKLTWEHSRNLASFVFGYKTLLAISRIFHIAMGDKVRSEPGLPVSQLDSFLAAAFTGHFVWGRYTSVNSQIVMYLLSRVLFALPVVMSEKGYKPFTQYKFASVYPWIASGVWGTVLWLYEYHPETLQKSLFGSMDFLYHQSNTGFDSVENFLPSPATAAVFVYLILRSREEMAKKR